MEMKQQIMEAKVPVVLTISTDEVERLCQKNGGLTLHELLSPMATLESQISIRSATHQFTTRGFRVRFVRSSELERRPLNVAEQHVVQAAMPTEEEAAMESFPPVRESQDIPSALHSMGENATPWYRRVKRAVSEAAAVSEYEWFDCPAACLMAVASSNPEPVACFEELLNPHYLPTPFQTGQFDPNLPRYFLLIHDPFESATVDPHEILRQMKSSFPAANCKLIQINSMPPESPHLSQPDLWGPFMQPVFFPENAPQQHAAVTPRVRGCCLSPEDLVGLTEFVSELITKGVLPCLERRVFTLNSSVSAVRKGVKNVIKSWWRSAPSGRGEEKVGASGRSDPSVAYRYDCIEGQIRLLADLSFMLRDYETALAMYRMAKDDFKTAKAWCHYACASEMQGLCLFMMDNDGRFRRDIDSAFDSAHTAFAKADDGRGIASGASSRPAHVSLPARLSTRCAMLAVDLNLNCPGQPRHREAAEALKRASSFETSLCAALLLEQAALCYLNVWLYRKYAFHLVMAGHLYHGSKQERHAVRCYASSVHTYENGRWSHIEDHVHFTLARQLFMLGQHAASVKYYLKLVDTGRQSAERQNTFLRDFLYICRSAKPALADAAAREDRAAVDGPQQQQQQQQQQLGGEVLEVRDLGLPVVLDGSGNGANQGQSTLNIFDWEEAHMCEAEDSDPGAVANATAAQAKQRQALKTDLELHSAVERGEGTWLGEPSSEPSARSRAARIQMEEPKQRVVGEPFVLAVKLHNPLAIKVEATDVQLTAILELEDGQIRTVSLPGRTEPSATTTEGSVAASATTAAGDMTDSAETTVVSAHPPRAAPIADTLRRLSASGAPFVPPEFPRRASSLFSGGTPVEVPQTASLSVNSEEGGVTNAAAISDDIPFEVDWQTVVLEPQSTVLLRLHICPRQCGTLHITGIRWRLFGEVWGLHAFSLKGKLLQNTIENREARARAPDTTLVSRVVGCMPWVHVSVPSPPVTVLQGEVRQLQLHLHNRGLAPAHGLVLNCNQPWLCVGSPQDLDKQWSDELSESISFVGSSGTSMVLRIPGGCLEPGESTHLPLWVRCQGGGKHTIRILVRFSPSDAATAFESTTAVHRFAATSFDVTIMPSLSLTASVLPSFNIVGEYLLALEVTNYCNDDANELDSSKNSVELQQICGVSRNWRMEPLVESKRTVLKWQERVTLFFRVTPTDVDELLHSDLPFHDGLVIASDTAPSLTFLCTDNASQLRAKAQRMHEKERAERAKQTLARGPRSIASVRRENRERQANGGGDGSTAAVDTQPTRPNALCQLPSELKVVVMWKASLAAANSWGQHHLHGIEVRPGGRSAAPKNPRQCPLTLTVRYERRVNHDFGTGIMCKVNVAVCVCNRLVDKSNPVNFIFETMRSEEGGADPSSPQPAFLWDGSTRHAVPALAAGGSVEIKLCACFMYPGVYNVNRFRFLVSNGESTTTFVFPSRFLLDIQQVQR